MIEFLIKMALYLAPMYFANSSAMLLGGKTRLDFGIHLSDNHPLFGNGKTIRGTIGGIVIGGAVGFLLSAIFRTQTSTLFGQYAYLSFLLAFGAIFGDIIGSFIKRRLGVESGTEAPFLDQLDFIAGAILLGMVIYTPTLPEIIFVCVLTFFVHKFSNFVAFKLNLKKVPW